MTACLTMVPGPSLLNRAVRMFGMRLSSADVRGQCRLVDSIQIEFAVSWAGKVCRKGNTDHSFGCPRVRSQLDYSRQNKTCTATPLTLSAKWSSGQGIHCPTVPISSEMVSMLSTRTLSSGKSSRQSKKFAAIEAFGWEERIEYGADIATAIPANSRVPR